MTEIKIKPTMEQTIYCLKAESERYPEVCEECQLYGEVGCDHCYDDTNDMAIKFLKELEQYRAIGTIEECRNAYAYGYNQGGIDRTEELQKCREYGYNKAIDEFAKKAIEHLEDMGCEAWRRDIEKIADQMKGSK